MRVVTKVPYDDLREAQAFARKAEQAGLDGVIAAENAHNPYLLLAAAALATERLQLGAAVAMAFPRSPTINAMISWDIHHASRGRFYMGFGSQIKAHNERRYGIPWSAPAPRMRDYVGAIRAIWRCWQTEEPLDYHSEHYTLTLMTPNFSPRPNDLPTPPISIAAVGPAMLRVAGQFCDGVRLHPLTTRRLLEEVINVQIDEGIKRGQRDRKNFEVMAGSFIATGPDEATVAKIREYVRYRIAFYCSTPGYWNVLRMHGIEDLGKKLNSYPREGRWKEMAAQVPDDVLNLFAVVGTYDTIAEQLKERYTGVVDTIALTAVPSDFDPVPLREVVEAIQRVPTRFERYNTDWDVPRQPATQAPKSTSAAVS